MFFFLAITVPLASATSLATSETVDEEAQPEEQEEGVEKEEEIEGEDVLEDGEADDEEKIEVAQEKGTSSPRPGKAKKLTNQFNFCERAALTYNNLDRVRRIKVEAFFSITCFVIFI